MKTWKHVFLASLCATLLAPLPGMAFSLGEISVQSYLGAPFRATIPLQAAPGENPATDCLSLAPPPPTKGMLYLRHAGFSLAKRDGELQLVISGVNAVNESYLNVFIQNDCQEQGQLVKKYTVLIDLPDHSASSQSIEPTPAVAKQPDLPKIRNESASPSRPGGVGAERSMAKRNKPAGRHKQPALSGEPSKDNLRVLSSGTEESAAEAGQTEMQRLQQKEKELTRHLDDMTAQLLAAQAHLVELESKLAEMRKALAQQDKLMASTKKPPAPPQEPASSWTDYWPVAPLVVLAVGLVFLLTRRMLGRSRNEDEPTRQLRGKASNPF